MISDRTYVQLRELDPSLVAPWASDFGLHFLEDPEEYQFLKENLPTSPWGKLRALVEEFPVQGQQELLWSALAYSWPLVAYQEVILGWEARQFLAWSRDCLQSQDWRPCRYARTRGYVPTEWWSCQWFLPRLRHIEERTHQKWLQAAERLWVSLEHSIEHPDLRGGQAAALEGIEKIHQAYPSYARPEIEGHLLLAIQVLVPRYLWPTEGETHHVQPQALAPL